MSRVPLVFDNDQISPNLIVSGTLYVDYNSSGVADGVYDSATGQDLGYVTVTNTKNDSTSVFEISKITNPNSGEYRLVFGDTANKVVILYSSESPTSATIKYHHDGKTTTGHNEPVQPCYCAGTHIATSRGEVAVEDLKVGDLILTNAGATRPVRWIGVRQLDVARHPDPTAVQPVRVRAGAFGDSMPARDLWMSPGHNVYIDGALMPARVLINGVTVLQEAVPTVTYVHVELDRHDVILAEGLPAESYLDTGNRTAFENGGAFVEMHPDFEPKHWAETCFPLVKSGPAVEAARTALLARIEQFGHTSSAIPDLHVRADGMRIEPIVLAGKRFGFALPLGCSTLSLVSRTFVPSQMKPDSTDTRVLGVSVKRLQIDGEDIDLRGPLAEGWHALEGESEHARRWTTGAVPLPAGARLVVVDLVGESNYWIERKDNVVALRA